MKITGAVLILLGLLMLAGGGIPYQKKQEVASIGDLKMQVSEQKHFALPPVVSGLVILVGAVLLFAGGRKPSA